MKRFTILFSLFVISISLTNCAVKQEFQSEFPQEIQSVFYQKAGNGNQAEELYFYIEFKKSLVTTIKLEKIYFHNQSAAVNKVNKNTFLAIFNDKKQDFILDSNPANEYGNKVPSLEKFKFDLKRNEAVLEYKKNRKKQFFKITDLKEKSIR